MKKIYLLLALVTLCLTSCFEDKGNYSYHDVNDIVIEGIAESYTNLSYADEVLEIDPVIKTNYTDLQYEWYMWDPTIEENYSGWDEEQNYKAELIGTEKKLSYKVNCPAKRYTIMLKVTSKENGYSVSASTRFDATTEFARGFYILKETPDGNSELDLYYREGEPVMSDLLTAKGHGPLKGKPLCLGALPSHGYITEEGEVKECHSISITTEEGDIAFYNTEDMNKVHDRSDAVFGGLSADEIPYAAFGCGMSNYLLTNKGTVLSYTYSIMPTMGSMGTRSTSAGSSLFMMSDGDYCTYFWDSTNHCIDYTDNIQMGRIWGDYDNNGFSTEGMECLMAGSIWATDPKTGYFLLKDEAGKKYLYVSELSGTPKTKDRKELDASSKMANATLFATSVRAANYIYFVYDNKLYGYNLSNFTENNSPMTLRGISADETITYLSYQWQEYTNDEENNFVHLVVGTQKGDTYRIYMYNIVAGEPRDLVRTIEGQGKLKMCVYMSPVSYNANGGDNASLPN